MEFRVKREDFLNAVAKTLGITDRKTPMPILNNVLVKAEDSQLKIVATDLKVGLITRIPAHVEQPGEITMPNRKLHEILRVLQGDDVSIAMNEQNNITVSAKSSVYRMRGLPADDYPSVVEKEDVPLYEIAAPLLINMIRRTQMAISHDELRANLTGVYLETEDSVNGPRLKMTATDTHRLAMAYSQPGEQGGLSITNGIIIPRKGVVEIRKLLEEEDDTTVQIGIAGGMFMVKTSCSVLKTNLMDDKYPDYRRAIPSDKGVSLRLEREEFIQALRRISVMSSETYQAVIMTLKGGKLVMNSPNPEVGEANDELEVSYGGEEVRAVYNVHYLIQPLEVMDTPE
ncbi:MAG: DNA polymerase III subunit beta, partial [Syntrophales bacterium]|nr:DNA polymerase III subunit beta [Syntrophales bacterium]